MSCSPIKFGVTAVAILAATVSFAQDGSDCKSSGHVTDEISVFNNEVFLQEQAEKDKNIAHANAFLRTINRRRSDVQQKGKQQRMVNEPSHQ